MAEIKTKKRGFGLELKTIRGRKGTYIFFRAKSGSYHTFLEVAAKEAARDCGAKEEHETRRMCKEVWDKN